MLNNLFKKILRKGLVFLFRQAVSGITTKEYLDRINFTAVDKERDTSTFPLALNISENYLVTEAEAESENKMWDFCEEKELRTVMLHSS